VENKRLHRGATVESYPMDEARHALANESGQKVSMFRKRSATGNKINFNFVFEVPQIPIVKP